MVISQFPLFLLFLSPSILLSTTLTRLQRASYKAHSWVLQYIFIYMKIRPIYCLEDYIPGFILFIFYIITYSTFCVNYLFLYFWYVTTLIARKLLLFLSTLKIVYLKTLTQVLFAWMTFTITKVVVSYSSLVSLLNLTLGYFFQYFSLILVLLVGSDSLLFMVMINKDYFELFTTYSL